MLVVGHDNNYPLLNIQIGNMRMALNEDELQRGS